MTVQLGLCQTWSEHKLLVFSFTGSIKTVTLFILWFYNPTPPETHNIVSQKRSKSGPQESDIKYMYHEFVLTLHNYQFRTNTMNLYNSPTILSKLHQVCDTQCQLTRVKFDGVLDLASADIHHDSVIDLDQGIRVPDSTAVTCRHKRYTLWSNLLPPHTAKLVLKKKDTGNN